jgi:hypothetical protein
MWLTADCVQPRFSAAAFRLPLSTALISARSFVTMQNASLNRLREKLSCKHEKN